MLYNVYCIGGMNITINDVGYIQYLYRPKTVGYYNTKSIEINPLQYHPVLFKIWMKNMCNNWMKKLPTSCCSIQQLQRGKSSCVTE